MSSTHSLTDGHHPYQREVFISWEELQLIRVATAIKETHSAELTRFLFINSVIYL